MANPWFEDTANVMETKLSEDSVYEGSFLRVTRETVRCANGKIHHREFIRHPGATVIVVLDDKQQTVIEWQWREPCARAFVEFPAGKKNAGEDAFLCAKRELEEETGLVAGKLTYLGQIRNAIGYSDEVIEVFVAQEMTQGRKHLDDGECIDMKRVPFEDVYRACVTGAIEDVKTLVAAFWVKAWLAGERLGTTREF